MSRIVKALGRGRGLVCYLTAGYPSLDDSVEYAMACVEGGADVLEIGVPFTDPVADGKVIQYTSQKALEAGMTPRMVFDLVKQLRDQTDVPIVLMGYYNPIFQIGEDRYVRLAVEAGADGMIVPDLPLEESLGLMEHCRLVGLDLVQLVSPTTPDERMSKIAASSSGFLYVVSALGTTGARTALPGDVGSLVGRAKRAARDLPVAVGFGVSRPEHAEQLYHAGADAVIVGSAVLQRIIEKQSPSEVQRFVHSLK